MALSYLVVASDLSHSNFSTSSLLPNIFPFRALIAKDDSISQWHNTDWKWHPTSLPFKLAFRRMEKPEQSECEDNKTQHNKLLSRH